MSIGSSAWPGRGYRVAKAGRGIRRPLRKVDALFVPKRIGWAWAVTIPGAAAISATTLVGLPIAGISV